MNEALKKARARLDEVIDQARAVAATERAPTHGIIGGPYLDNAQYTAWRLSGLTVLKRLASSTPFEEEWQSIEQSPSSSPFALKAQVAVLEALRSNFDGGHLGDIRGLIRGEVFADFVEQAQHLFDEGYWQPAAVIVGAVLEDHLRKLCAKHGGITLPAKPKLDGMNSELAKAGEYDKLAQKQITVWADLRNKAAHGEWAAFKKDDVHEMLRGVLRFLVEHPA